MLVPQSRWEARWSYWRIALAILVVLVPLTVGAVRSFPLYDDAGFQLIVKENGPHAVFSALTNRPVFGWLYQKAILSSYDKPGGLLLQFLGWGLFGWLSGMIWNRLFPDLRRYAPVAACLTVAPLLVKCQMETWLFVLPVNLAVIAAYGAGLLLADYTEKGRRPLLLLGLSGCLTLAGAMLSEYAFLGTIASGILLLSLTWKADRPKRLRVIQSFAILAVAALAARFLFLRIADPHPIYGTVSFTPPAREILTHLPTYGMRVLRAFWYSTAGTYGQALGIAAGQPAHESTTFATIFYPILVAAALAWACRPFRREHNESESKRGFHLVGLGAFLLALLATLSPAYLFRPILMGRDLHLEELGTRVYFTAAPLAVALTLRVLLGISRRKLWFVVPSALGFLAGDAVLREVHSTASAIQAMQRMGPVLEPYVKDNPDLTLVLTPDYYARDVEVTYRASASWPAQLSRKLLIFWEGRLPTVVPGTHPIRGAGCKDIKSVDRNMDTIIRRGKIGRLLYLEPLANGGFSVEPYCLERPVQ